MQDATPLTLDQEWFRVLRQNRVRLAWRRGMLVRRHARATGPTRRQTRGRSAAVFGRSSTASTWCFRAGGRLTTAARLGTSLRSGYEGLVAKDLRRELVRRACGACRCHLPRPRTPRGGLGEPEGGNRIPAHTPVYFRSRGSATSSWPRCPSARR